MGKVRKIKSDKVSRLAAQADQYMPPLRDCRRWHAVHNDPATSVATSKQVCAKPISTVLWPFEEVEGHLDQLELVCDIEESGEMVRYQAGTLASIRPLVDLIERSGLGEGVAMLCGTLAAIGGVRPATRYRMALIDPVRDRKLALDYSVTALPVIA